MPPATRSDVSGAPVAGSQIDHFAASTGVNG